MSPTVVAVSIGEFEIVDRVNDAGIRVIDAIDPDVPEHVRANLQETDYFLDFYADLFGPYPFVAYGSVYDDIVLGYALEAQTRPVYVSAYVGMGSTYTAAMQWSGDLVTPATTSDMWLSDGWAMYGSLMSYEALSGESAYEWTRGFYDDLAEGDETWAFALASPGPEQVMGPHGAIKGAMAIAQIHKTVGDEAFRTIAREWVARNADRLVTGEDLRALAEEISGQDLGPLFEAWVYSAGKPAQF